MEFTPPNVQLGAIAPEIALCVTAFVVLLVDTFTGDRRDRWYLPLLATIGLGVSIWLAYDVWDSMQVRIANPNLTSPDPQLQMAGMVVLDGFATFVKISLAVFGILTVWLAHDYLMREEIETAEFYGLVVFSIAGMMLMASSANLILTFLALETFSLALYVLVGFRRRSLIGQESAMKYFLLGAFSSTFFLLGIALVYGATGSASFYGGGGSDGLATYLQGTSASDVGLLLVGIGFLIVGLGFKVAAVPFHMWTPDAYQGAPSPVTGFMAAGSKLAGFAALLRLLDGTLFSFRWDWRPLVIVIAILTMVVGSVLAVVQEDIKRLLAYSSIAHAGFVLTAIIATNDDGVSGALFYLAVYGVTVLGAFAVVAFVAGRDETRVRLSDMRGLFYERPAMAGALTLFLLSLAGVPLTSGFIAKFVVFGAAIQAGYSWLVVIGMLASAIAAFFYLRVMVVMYMQEPEEGRQEVESLGRFAGGVVALTAAATLVLGILWSPLIEAARDATMFFSTG
jgi:NADH-quinone oxidoreductase subunit N